MKQKLLLLTGTCLLALNAFATMHTITVGPGGGMTFSPAAIANVHPGDTVKWVWSSGVHTTTSNGIPSGAANWDAPITSSATTYTYVVPNKLGTYNYKCTPHFSMGMTGSFTVVSSTNVANVQGKVFSMYPNPAQNVLHLNVSNTSAPVTIAITDLTGHEVKKAIYSPGTIDVNLDGIANGTYIIRATQGSAVHTEQLMIAR